MLKFGVGCLCVSDTYAQWEYGNLVDLSFTICGIVIGCEVDL